MIFNRMLRSVARWRNHVNSSVTTSYQRGEWLPECYGGLVWQLNLSGAIDVLDTDALWDHASGSGRDIVDSEGRRERRLRRALEDHQRWQRRQGPVPGRWVEDSQCFTDLIMHLPINVWMRDLRNNNGERIRQAMQNLVWLHEQSFAKSLPIGRPPRYLIRPDPKLTDGKVAFLFGTGVYVPDPEDVPAFYMQLLLDGEPIVPSPSVKIWHKGLLQDYPVGFYADQGCLMFTPNGEGPLPLEDWQAPLGSYLFIRRVGDNDWDSYADGKARIQKRQDRRAWIFERHSNDQADRQAPEAGVYKLLALELTKEPPVAALYMLEFAAIVLPDLISGLRQWTVWLTADGVLATPQQIRTGDNLITLRLDQHGLWLVMPGLEGIFLGNKVTTDVIIGDSSAKLSPVAARGVRGLLWFSRAIVYTVDQEPRILGRDNHESNDEQGLQGKREGYEAVDKSDSAILQAGTTIIGGQWAPSTHSPQIIILDQLAQPGGLLWSTQHQHPDWTMANIGLSRRHVKVWVDGEQLYATPVEPHCLLRTLGKDKQLRIVPPEINGGRGGPHISKEEPLRLEVGEGLLVGNCLLRFNVENINQW